jgi:hypothetical protein
MGSGTIVVIGKNGQPLRDQKVTISWNWIGISTGVQESTTNNFGDAIFNGVPAFSAGDGRIKGPIGEYAEFSVGSDAYGNFAKMPVQVSWNPVESLTSGISDTAKGAVKAVTQIGILGVIIGVIALIGYAVYKRSAAGQLMAKVRGMF